MLKPKKCLLIILQVFRVSTGYTLIATLNYLEHTSPNKIKMIIQILNEHRVMSV